MRRKVYGAEWPQSNMRGSESAKIYLTTNITASRLKIKSCHCIFLAVRPFQQNGVLAPSKGRTTFVKISERMIRSSKLHYTTIGIREENHRGFSDVLLR